MSRIWDIPITIKMTTRISFQNSAYFCGINKNFIENFVMTMLTLNNIPELEKQLSFVILITYWLYLAMCWLD